MTKNVQVLKFNVRRDGVRYGMGQPAGNIMYDLPAEEADKLIAESNGTIVELPNREDVQSKVKSGANRQKEKASGGKTAAGKEGTGDPGNDILPPIDPNATVK